jgi:hypothetical protein
MPGHPRASRFTSVIRDGPAAQAETGVTIYDRKIYVGYGEDVSAKKQPPLPSPPNGLEDIETAALWAGWMIWMECSRKSPRWVMSQEKLAARSGISGPSLSNAMNRNHERGIPLIKDWIKFTDYMRISPSDAIEQARRWKTTEAGVAWLTGPDPIAADALLPEPSENLATGLANLRRRGQAFSSAVLEALLDSLKTGGDHSVAEWELLIQNTQSQEARAALERDRAEDRALAAAMRRPAHGKKRSRKTAPGDADTHKRKK